LRAGRMVAQGNPAMVVGQYLDEQSAATRRRTPMDWPTLYTRTGAELRVNENRFGSLELEITDVRLFDPAGVPTPELERGDPLRIEIEYVSPQPVPAPIFGVTITREDGLICCDTSTAGASLIPPTIHGRGRITLFLERLDLEGGQYYVDVGVYEAGWAYAYDYHWHVYPLLIHAPGGHLGVLRPPHRWAIGDPPAFEGKAPAMRALE
jgi:lipopolysaccharide transport system ATP-binding protein